jgi:hypothetical protein
MKTQVIFLYLVIFCFACKTEGPLPDCICANLEVINEFPKVQQEGLIIFPKAGSKTMYLLKPDKRVDTIWHQGLYGICTDSAFLKQIQDKQIKDSTQVILTGIGLGTFGWCNVTVQRSVLTNTTYNPGLDFATTLRAKTIDKK